MGDLINLMEYKRKREEEELARQGIFAVNIPTNLLFFPLADMEKIFFYEEGDE